MGFLRRLLGSGEQPPDRRSASSWEHRPASMRDGMDVQLYAGRENLNVVGEASYQDSLWRAVGGRGLPEDRVRVDVVAVLVAETDNPYDANAVSVWVQGLKVGYLSRDDARRYRPGLLALEQKHGKPIALSGAIVGGGSERTAQDGLACSSTMTPQTSAFGPCRHPACDGRCVSESALPTPLQPTSHPSPHAKDPDDNQAAH